MISDHPIVKKIAWTSGTRRTGASMDTHREYIVEIPDYVPPFDPAVRTASLGEEIVRCRDCRYYDEIIHACDHPNVAPLRGDCPENWIFSCFDNGFCAWGERRDA